MSISPPDQSLQAVVREGRRFWESSPGLALWRAERACLGPHCEQHRGIVSLQLGMAPLMSDMCPIRHALDWAPSADLVRTGNSLICLPDSLPLTDDSVDLVLVHHLLEAVERPHHVLQEAARVTRPDGRLLVFGWHPFGPTAVRRRQRPAPWQRQWRTPGRLRDWLAFVDFEIERVDYCGFRLPGRAIGSDRLETLGRRYNVPLASAYLLVARRRSLPVQPIKLRDPVLRGSKSGAWLGLAKETANVRPHNREESSRRPIRAVRAAAFDEVLFSEALFQENLSKETLSKKTWFNEIRLDETPFDEALPRKAPGDVKAIPAGAACLGDSFVSRRDNDGDREVSCAGAPQATT